MVPGPLTASQGQSESIRSNLKLQGQIWKFNVNLKMQGQIWMCKVKFECKRSNLNVQGQIWKYKVKFESAQLNHGLVFWWIYQVSVGLLVGDATAKLEDYEL